MRKVLLYVLCGMFMLAAHPAAAQEQEAPDRRAFNTFAPGIGGAAQISQSAFQGKWASPAGVEVFLSTPFYAGETQIGAQVLPFSPKRSDLPSFMTYFLYSQWVNDLYIWKDVEVYAGLRVGIYIMQFEDRRGPHGAEQEVAARVITGVQYDCANWAVYAQLGYGAVVLSTPVSQGLITIGISHSFTTPAWLQEVFL